MAMSPSVPNSMSAPKTLIKRALELGLNTIRVLRPEKRFDMKRICREYGIDTKGLVHLGANDGMEAAVYERCGFSSVLWVEGYSKFYERLVQHLKRFPGQRAMHVLISDQDGEQIRFRIAKNGVSSTVFSPGARYFEDFPNVEFVETEPLRARRLDRMFEEERVDLSAYNVLVLDLEGSELKALQSLGTSIDHFDWIGIEISVTDNYLSGPRLKDIDAFLVARGFKRIETIMGSSSGDAIYRRCHVGAIDRLEMRVTETFYSAGYYLLYRDGIVKKVKRWLAA
jgi:FkbM family methyltransferase